MRRTAAVRWTEIWTRPWFWALAALLTISVFPGIDLAASGLFYRAGEGFPLRNWPPFLAAMRAISILGVGVGVAAGVAGIAAALSDRKWLDVTPRAAAYLVVSLLLGPGLLVNTVLKDHWGRARPHQILEFGGTLRFSPAILPADQCTANCSFPSGHAALAFWFLALVPLAPPPWRVRARAAGIALGCAIGAMRIVQGGHFLSDVIAAALLVLFFNYWTQYFIVDQ